MRCVTNLSAGAIDDWMHWGNVNITAVWSSNPAATGLIMCKGRAHAISKLEAWMGSLTGLDVSRTGIVIAGNIDYSEGLTDY